MTLAIFYHETFVAVGANLLHKVGATIDGLVWDEVSAVVHASVWVTIAVPTVLETKGR